MQATLQPSFSFYVGPSIPARITAAARLADAVTIGGKGGPDAIRKLRKIDQFQTPVIFDRRGYELGAGPIDVARWIDEQLKAGADRVLTSGRLARYTAADPTAWQDELRSELAVAGEFEATALVALDARILARFASELIAISRRRRPVEPRWRYRRPHPAVTQRIGSQRAEIRPWGNCGASLRRRSRGDWTRWTHASLLDGPRTSKANQNESGIRAVLPRLVHCRPDCRLGGCRASIGLPAPML